MFELHRTRAELLAGIGTPDADWLPCGDPADPGAVSGSLRIVASGSDKKDLFGFLEIILAKRYAELPRPELIRDLLLPLRNALGNAFRYGGSGDRPAMVSVELMLGEDGALIAVTDGGEGFDVPRTLRRFLRSEKYFRNRGTGFRNLHAAAGPVTFDDGGRTLLLCFRPSCGAASTLMGTGTAGLEEQLGEDLAVLESGTARLALLTVHPMGEGASLPCGVRCLLYTDASGPLVSRTRVLSGTFHPVEGAARADIEMTRLFHDAGFSRRLRIPRPVLRVAAEPRIVLFDFNPWLSLREYLDTRGGLEPIRRFAWRMGAALARMHGSRVRLRPATRAPVKDLLTSSLERARSSLDRTPDGAGLRSRLDRFARSTAARARSLRWAPAVPIHGAIGWERIHFGADGRFYLQGFESARLSDPAFDLGGFAADLVRYTSDRGLCSDVRRVCLDALLERYNRDAPVSLAVEDVRAYAALALLRRLPQEVAGRASGPAGVFGALEALLQDTG